MLSLADHHFDEVVAHCLAALPFEGCGVLLGRAQGTAGAVVEVVGVANAARSALRYRIDPREFLRVDERADAAGLSILGVFHSHTHTEAYPSPTDVAEAPDASWHYVLVSLRDTHPVLRSYAIVDGAVAEEPVVVDAAPG